MTVLATIGPDEILQELSTDLMSPYCPGRTIASCPSPQARKLEDHILAQAKAGHSREEIEAQLVARFGTDIVGYEGQPVLLYGSALIGVLALLVLVIMGRRWSNKSSAARPSAAAAGAVGTAGNPTQAELDRLEDALDDLDDF